MLCKSTFTILFLVVSLLSSGQNLSGKNLSLLQLKEDSLKSIATEIIMGRNAIDRFKADSQFTRMLVRALQIKSSFEYPFDSLKSISILIPQDSSFKIFTWQLVIDDNTIRQHGAIQMPSEDGSLRLFPLIDKSPQIDQPEQWISDNLSWIGAIYYAVKENVAFGKKVYTLLGYDENNFRSNRKIVEILTFENGKPVFGGAYFSFRGKANQPDIARYIITYKKHTGPRLNFDEALGIIVMEHLISETGEPEKKYTYIPDGDYEGLQWMEGKWVYVPKIFTQVTPEGEPPVPQPLEKEELQLMPKDNDGNR